MDIASLFENLSDDDISRLKKTAEQFLGTGNKDAEEKTADTKTENNPLLDKDMLSYAAKLSSLTSSNDDRTNFIAALKPLLSEGRKKKADEATNMLRLMRIINLIKENGL